VAFFLQLGIVFFSSKSFFLPLIFFSYFLCIFGRPGSLFSPFFVVNNSFSSKKGHTSKARQENCAKKAINLEKSPARFSSEIEMPRLGSARNL
jgi:hypothetical protein